MPKPRTQEELDLFYLPTDGTTWDEQLLLETRQWYEDKEAQREYKVWLDSINERKT